MKIKNKIIFGISILIIIFLFGFIAAQGATYCAEKVRGSEIFCQNGQESECDTGVSLITTQPYRCDRTACESTTYCSSRGTCLDTNTGTCFSAPESRCDPAKGGVFYSQPKEDVERCDIGCCILGSDTTLTERARCESLGRDYVITEEFRDNIQDDLSCRALASPETEGACVFETEVGRDCDFTTRGQCQESDREFHAGLLCSAQVVLGTICARTELTSCFDGTHEVYFVDSCGNPANVYDANKVSDTNYWTYIAGSVEGVEVDPGDGLGNINNETYGACEYIFGSTCGLESGSPNRATYGDYICRDLGCAASPLTGGSGRKHGEEWCSEPIENFENAKPGDVSYLLSCVKGEVQYTLCSPYRYRLCSAETASVETTSEDGAVTTSLVETGSAGCVLNRGGDCLLQNNTADCLGTELRDCKVQVGASILRTMYGTEKPFINSTSGEEIPRATCVPKYPFGLKFWDPEGTMAELEETPTSVCSISNVRCFVNYTQEIVLITAWRPTAEDSCVATCMEVEGWVRPKCYQACTPICLEVEGWFTSKNFEATVNEPWASGWQGVCTSLGDCGVKGNYLEKNGSNSWKDLFSGEKIDWTTLVNADNRQ